MHAAEGRRGGKTYIVSWIPLRCNIDSTIRLRDGPICPGSLEVVPFHTHVFRFSVAVLVLLRVGPPYANLAVVPFKAGANSWTGISSVVGDGDRAGVTEGRRANERNNTQCTRRYSLVGQRIGHAMFEMLERSITANQQLPPTTAAAAAALPQRVLFVFGPWHPGKQERGFEEKGTYSINKVLDPHAHSKAPTECGEDQIAWLKERNLLGGEFVVGGAS